MIEPGTYRGQLQNAVTTQAKTGSLQFALTFEILERWDGTNWQGVIPYERKVFMSLTDKAWPYSSSKLEALKFNGDFENPEFCTPPEGVTLACTHDTYEGTTRERWDLNSWGGEPEQAATDKLKRLSAKWRATAPAGGTSPPSSTPQAAPPSAPSAAPATPAAATRASTRDAAWAKLNQVWAGKPAADLQERWFAAIQEQRKPETAFTPADWAIVEDTFEIPF